MTRSWSSTWILSSSGLKEPTLKPTENPEPLTATWKIDFHFSKFRSSFLHSWSQLKFGFVKIPAYANHKSDVQDKWLNAPSVFRVICFRMFLNWIFLKFCHILHMDRRIRLSSSCVGIRHLAKSNFYGIPQNSIQYTIELMNLKESMKWWNSTGFFSKKSM